MRAPHVVVIGGGITGLTAAYRAAQRQVAGYGLRVTLLEGSTRCGGWIATDTHDGALFEKGPRGLRPSTVAGQRAVALAEDLGLSAEVITADKSSKRRFVFAHGELQELPSSLWDALRSPFARRALSAIVREPFAAKGTADDETVDSFFRRRVGDYVTDHLVDAIVLGVYGGDSRALSARACFTSLFDAERAHGSIVKGMLAGKKSSSPSPRDGPRPLATQLRGEALFSFRTGMEALPKALETQLGAKVQRGARAVSLTALSAGGVRVALQDGTAVTADAALITTPPSLTAEILRAGGASSVSPEHVNEAVGILGNMKSAGIAIVGLTARAESVPIRGFGFLVPSIERRGILGATIDSHTFPQQAGDPAQARITVMLGGARKPEVLDVSEAVLIDRALASLREMFPTLADVSVKHSVQHREAIPQYAVGHMERCESARAALRGAGAPIALAGAGFDGVGVNDCIVSAERAVDEITAALSRS